MTKGKDILKRIASILLVLALSISTFGSIFEYARADAYSTLGTNKALGSPVLNPNFSADDWNKWEMITWGIFLSNFAFPFVDNYNTAFNLSSGGGSEGSGVKALQFGSGNDPANNKILQDLLDFAINQQLQGGVKPIKVSYTKMTNGEFDQKSQFSTSTGTTNLFGEAASYSSDNTGDDASNNTGDETADNTTGSEDQIQGETSTTSALVRDANIGDLFFSINGTGFFHSGGSDGTTWAGSTSGNWVLKTALETDNYMSMTAIVDGSIPTFAILTSTNTYETVLDYTDAYDLSVIASVMARGLGADATLKNKFVESFNKMAENPESYKLYLDCFGNITTNIDGQYIVLIPASANKYLTKNPSINLVNSLIFNSNVSTAGQEDLVLHAGQGTEFSIFKLASLGKDWIGGGLAVSNGTPGVPAGTTLLFYDTDTIVMQKALQSGTQLNGSKYTVDVGEVYKDLYSLDITKQSQPYAFKIEQANINDLTSEADLNDKADGAISSTFLAVSQLTNLFNTMPETPVLTDIETDTGTISMFDDPVVVPVQMEDGGNLSLISNFGNIVPFSNKKNLNTRAIYRRFSNWVYQTSQKDYNTSAGMVYKADVLKALDNSDTVSDIFDNLLVTGDNQLSTLLKSFVLRRTDLYKSTSIAELNSARFNSGILGSIVDFVSVSSPDGPAGALLGGDITNKSIQINKNIENDAFNIFGGDSANRSPFARSIKLYATSEVMRSVANILGVREGTDFSVFSTYIYLTYLKWYGITGTTKATLSPGQEDSANFNTRIFDTSSDILNTDINSIVSVMSDEEKEKKILDWTYTLLNPTEGRSYRSNMIISGVADFIYDNYQKIVYGNASSYYNTGTGITSRNSTGFLSLQPYSENFLTAWFISNYSYFATVFIGLFLVLIIIMGLLKRRKLSWFFVTTIVMINMILILPAFGEVSPLMANNFVQDMFSDKMTYWGLSEQVQNAKMEADYVTGNTISTGYMNSLSSQEQQQVINLVKNLNVLYTDRSLMLRQDISKKVSGIANSTYEDVQQLRSARWMLPMIMREFTETADNANYIYVPMSDKLEDLSNMYWYFEPDWAIKSKTVNGQQTGNFEQFKGNYSNPTSRVDDVYGGFINHSSNYDKDSDIPYKQKSYETESSDNNVHTYSYYLDFNALTGYKPPEYTSGMSYSEWASAAAELAVESLKGSSDFAGKERELESFAGEYNRFYRETIQGNYSYLWATENPLHYFYQGITQCFSADATEGSIIGELYGEYVEKDDGTEAHKTFMHAGETGYLRDLLDFEEMFKNMLPYLYGMQLGAEGYNEVEGYFEEGDMIEGYPKHEFLNKSWMFRSNWVTKIMENSELHGEGHIRLSDGTQATVPNMLLPSCYETAGRPMIFSEAQMHAEGLDEADLSLVELKCLAVNKQVYQNWSMLINYASVKGLTREVMVRQMALDALFAFNREFSPVGVIGGAYQMYPVGLDLRSISFDSVMKMLMLNVTHDTAYIYGNTMQTIVEDADIGTALLLLITAWVCAYAIPIARNVLMGVILYLGLWAIIWAIMKDTKTKAKVTCGYMVSNLVFLIMTFIYYLVIKALVTMSSTDEVLTMSQVEINTGNPVWCLLVVLAVSIAYIIFMIRMLLMLWKSYKDMGFEIYAGIAELAASNVSNKLEKFNTSISEAFGAGDHSGSFTGARRTMGRRKAEPIEVRDTSSDRAMQPGGHTNTKKQSVSSGSDYDTDDYTTSGYTDGRYKDNDSPGGSRDIDSEISKGKEIERKEKEEEQKSSGEHSNRSQSPK